MEPLVFVCFKLSSLIESLNHHKRRSSGSVDCEHSIIFNMQYMSCDRVRKKITWWCNSLARRSAAVSAGQAHIVRRAANVLSHPSKQIQNYSKTYRIAQYTFSSFLYISDQNIWKWSEQGYDNRPIQIQSCQPHDVQPRETYQKNEWDGGLQAWDMLMEMWQTET